jgi:hypothetical protein
MTSSSSYERLKRCRQRRRRGRIVLPVEVDADQLADVLIEAGFLQAWNARDRGELRKALEAALGSWTEA